MHWNLLKITEINLSWKCSSILVKIVCAASLWMELKASKGESEVGTDLGSPILMPIGEKINGRLFNVTGDAIDGLPQVSKEGGRPIHNKPPLV